MFDREYEIWKGNIGPGAALRESIQRDNEERSSMATKTATPPVKSIKIDADVIALLKTGTWKQTATGDPAFTMPMTSDRKLYQKTAKVLESLGGKWVRKEQATVFAEDIDADIAVREACETGTYIDSKQLYQFFETPPAVSSWMVKNLCLNLKEKLTVLEPSAGHGALIIAVAEACVTDTDITLTGVELDSKKETRLREMTGSPGCVMQKLVMGDFMSMRPAELGTFDRVIMNPPFTRGQDMDHVRHAYGFLKPGGILVAVMSPAFTYRSDKSTVAFREWMDELEARGHATHVPLPEGSFKVSGTNVRTVMMTIRKGKS